MLITNTYVTSVNGKNGDTPDGLSTFEKILILDATDIRVTGSTGNTIPQELNVIANTVKPLLITRIENSSDYIMSVGVGVPYQPTA